jgi:hypothetical protein
MAKYRKHISNKMKLHLIKEAGMKCANPGCSNYRVQIHHIKEWAVYETHDKKHMIAICPTCHDTVHFGNLKIDDDTLYEWKDISRKKTNRDQIYVEPGESSKLLLGTLAVMGPSGISVFEFSPNNKLSFRLVDEDIFLITLNISNSKGQEIFKVVENHLKYSINPPLEFERRPGRVRITAPAIEEYIPLWMRSQIYKLEADFFKEERFPVIDIEVIKPGLVRVEGLWINNLSGVCISKNYLSFLSYELPRPISLCGEDEESVLYYSGSINSSMFDIG